MGYTTYKEIRSEETGNSFGIGQTVSIVFNSGGGCGGCRITKITDTGFHYTQDGKRNKSVQYKDIREIY